MVKVVKLENQRENNDNHVSTKLKASLFSDNYGINVLTIATVFKYSRDIDHLAGSR